MLGSRIRRSSKIAFCHHCSVSTIPPCNAPPTDKHDAPTRFLDKHWRLIHVHNMSHHPKLLAHKLCWGLLQCIETSSNNSLNTPEQQGPLGGLVSPTTVFSGLVGSSTGGLLTPTEQLTESMKPDRHMCTSEKHLFANDIFSVNHSLILTSFSWARSCRLGLK